MNKLILFFQGKKSYIIGLLGIVLGIIGENAELIVLGFGIVALRAGIKTTLNTTTKEEEEENDLPLDGTPA